MVRKAAHHVLVPGDMQQLTEPRTKKEQFSLYFTVANGILLAGEFFTFHFCPPGSQDGDIVLWYNVSPVSDTLDWI